MIANDSGAAAESDRDGSDELEFVVQHIAAVLSGHQSRQLLYELALETEAGTDFGQAIDWDVLDIAAVERLVRIAVTASMCRAMLLIIYADKRSRQDELVAWLLNHFDQSTVSEISRELKIDLEPLRSCFDCHSDSL